MCKTITHALTYYVSNDKAHASKKPKNSTQIGIKIWHLGWGKIIVVLIHYVRSCKLRKEMEK